MDDPGEFRATKCTDAPEVSLDVCGSQSSPSDRSQGLGNITQEELQPHQEEDHGEEDLQPPGVHSLVEAGAKAGSDDRPREKSQT